MGPKPTRSSTGIKEELRSSVKTEAKKTGRRGTHKKKLGAAKRKVGRPPGAKNSDNKKLEAAKRKVGRPPGAKNSDNKKLEAAKRKVRGRVGRPPGTTKSNPKEGRRGRPKKVLGIPPWFSKHYSSHRHSLRTFFRTEKCPDCEYKSTSVKQNKNATMARHLTTHLQKKLPCPNCQCLVSNDAMLSYHRKKGCGGQR
jgi:hypothetical protein